MIDPLFATAIAWGFAVLFVGAAWHKASAPGRFEAVLRDYKLLPPFLSRPAAVLIPAIELLLGLGWISGARIAAVTSAALLAIYALAMVINLARGRIYIDCGCGFGPTAETEQVVSSSLVARNMLLLCLALSILLPVAERDLGIIDYVVVLATVLTAMFLYAATGQLIRNRAAIAAWRGK